MRRILKPAFLVLALSLAGCGGGAGLPARSPFAADLVAEHRTRALAYEQDDELQRALLSWRVVLFLEPKNSEAAGRIAQLSSRARQGGMEHYQQAMRWRGKGEEQKARIELLKALRLAPDNREAYAALFYEENMNEHRVAKGETLEGIARKYYQNPEYAQLIALVNGLSSADGVLKPGALLRFPKFAPRPEKEEPSRDADTEKLIALARKSFQNKEYEAAISSAKMVVNLDYTNREAVDLLNHASLFFARELLEKEDFVGAEAALANVDDDYPALRPAQAELAARRLGAAERHYRNGVQFFVNEQLQLAIGEWRETLRIYPGHERARDDIGKARGILEKLKKVQ
ncbi:LysM peptidoglycan-binding domain-containing protein [Thiovibrio sp. JS02]